MLILEQPQFVFVLNWHFLFIGCLLFRPECHPNSGSEGYSAPPLTPLLPEVEHLNIRAYEPAKE